MRRRKAFFIATSVAFLSFIVSVAIGIIQINRISSDGKAGAVSTATHIYDTICSSLVGPMAVARTMSSSPLTDAYLNNTAGLPEDEIRQLLTGYLKDIKDGTGFPYVFLISDTTRELYTGEGSSGRIEKNGDALDVWYSAFSASGNQQNINVARGVLGKDDWMILSNCRIEDPAGNFVGIAGTGITLSSIQKLIRDYEAEENVRIELTDKDSRVLVDSDHINIENSFPNIVRDPDIETDYVYSSNGSDGHSVTRYLDLLGWYLIVHIYSEDVSPSLVSYFVINVIALIIIITAISTFFYMLPKESGRATDGFPETDHLTGLHNRNYFKNCFSEDGYFNTTKYRSLAYCDVDHFKEFNEKEGNDGNQTLRKIAILALEATGDAGEVLRWGGDGFVLLLEADEEKACKICRRLVTSVEKNMTVTLSVGLAGVRLSDKIKKILYVAVQNCYIVKELGGNGVKSK